MNEIDYTMFDDWGHVANIARDLNKEVTVSAVRIIELDDGIKALRATVARLEGELREAREALHQLLDVADWYTSFYNDVISVCPEYVGLCGDWNATVFLKEQACAIEEFARRTLAKEE